MQLPITPEENITSGICFMGTVSPATGAVSGSLACSLLLPSCSASPASILRDFFLLSRLKLAERRAAASPSGRASSKRSSSSR